MVSDMETSHIGEDGLRSAEIQGKTGGPHIGDVGRLNAMGRGQLAFGREIKPIGEKAQHETAFSWDCVSRQSQFL